MTGTFPPPGFIKVESAIEGITVYAPAPEDLKHEEVVNFKCPNCGADRAYSAADGGLSCSYCGYHEEPQAKQVGRAAEEFEFTVETVQQASHGWGVDRLELQCQNCNAATTLPAESMSHTCPFCNSVNVIQRKAPQDLLRPRFLIPLKVQDAECKSWTRQWLGSSWMVPAELKASAIIDNFSPIYLPFWTFDANTNASWKAQVGHTRTTGSGKNRRTKTVWRWENGQVSLTHDDLIVPGSTNVSEILVNRAADYDTSGLVEYDPSFLAGIQAQAYERNLDTAWEIGQGLMREKTKQACMNQCSSKKIRNFSMEMAFSNEAWRYVLMPVYVSAYQYNDQRYQVLVNGQTGKVSGQRPVAWIKVGSVIALALAIPAILLLIGVFGGVLEQITGQNPTADGLQLVAVIAFFIFSVIGGWAMRLITQAMGMDDA